MCIYQRALYHYQNFFLGWRDYRRAAPPFCHCGATHVSD